MANEENLIPFSERTEKEQREIRSAGGKASQKKRKERKKMREQAELLLSLPLKNVELQNKLQELGVDGKNIDNQMAMLIAVWKEAVTGNIYAFNSLRELVGEKQTDLKLDGGMTINFEGEKDIED